MMKKITDYKVGDTLYFHNNFLHKIITGKVVDKHEDSILIQYEETHSIDVYPIHFADIDSNTSGVQKYEGLIFSDNLELLKIYVRGYLDGVAFESLRGMKRVESDKKRRDRSIAFSILQCGDVTIPTDNELADIYNNYNVKQGEYIIPLVYKEDEDNYTMICDKDATLENVRKYGFQDNVVESIKKFLYSRENLQGKNVDIFLPKFMVGNSVVCDFRTDLDELKTDTDLLNKLIEFKKNERL